MDSDVGDSTLVTPYKLEELEQSVQMPTLTIAYHPYAERIGQQAILRDLRENKAVSLSRLEPLFTSPRASAGTRGDPLADAYISRKPIVLQPDFNGINIQAPDSAGALRINGRPLFEGFTVSPAALEKGVVLSISNRVVLLLHNSASIPPRFNQEHGMVGEHVSLAEARNAIDKVADLNISVLIRGETGTGKELIAQAIHESSHRHDKPMVSVNMAAIPASLAIAELFGAQKGAYTGATKDKAGFFQQAEGGTLFLDEIGDTPDELQVALLRTLETRQIQPVGASSPVSVNVRLIAATDADLEKKIEQDDFRNPLLQRLAGFEINLLPVRERRADIGRMMIHFLSQELSKVDESARLAPDSQDVYSWAKLFTEGLQYDWPGNVRQILNIIQQIVIYSRGSDRVSLPKNVQTLFMNPVQDDLVAQSDAQNAQLGASLAEQKAAAAEQLKVERASRRKPSEITEDELTDALKECRWDLSSTAQTLNISRAALYKMIDSNPNVRKAGDIPVQEMRDCFQSLSGDIDAMVSQLKVSKAALKRRLKELELIV